MPVFFRYPRTALSLKKTHIVLDNFNTYLKKLGKKYAAGGELLNYLFSIRFIYM